MAPHQNSHGNGLACSHLTAMRHAFHWQSVHIITCRL